jgi:hypothetical protein
MRRFGNSSSQTDVMSDTGTVGVVQIWTEPDAGTAGMSVRSVPTRGERPTRLRCI